MVGLTRRLRRSRRTSQAGSRQKSDRNTIAVTSLYDDDVWIQQSLLRWRLEHETPGCAQAGLHIWLLYFYDTAARKKRQNACDAAGWQNDSK